MIEYDMLVKEYNEKAVICRIGCEDLCEICRAFGYAMVDEDGECWCLKWGETEVN